MATFSWPRPVQRTAWTLKRTSAAAIGRRRSRAASAVSLVYGPWWAPWDVWDMDPPGIDSCARRRAWVGDRRAASGGGARRRGAPRPGDEPRRPREPAVAALGVGEHERALGARDRDVGQAALLLERVAERRVLGGEGAFLAAAAEHDPPPP